jgi:hypothetical protein
MRLNAFVIMLSASLLSVTFPSLAWANDDDWPELNVRVQLLETLWTLGDLTGTTKVLINEIATVKHGHYDIYHKLFDNDNTMVHISRVRKGAITVPLPNVGFPGRWMPISLSAEVFGAGNATTIDRGILFTPGGPLVNANVFLTIKLPGQTPKYRTLRLTISSLTAGRAPREVEL